MKKWINFISEWFLKLWRVVLYIGGMIALILGVTDVLHDDFSLILFLNCMVIILLPRICDEVFDPLLKNDNKEN